MPFKILNVPYHRQSERISPKPDDNMTTYTGTQETMELEILDEIERPENNLWVYTADDPEVNHRIANAIVHGEYLSVHRISFIIYLVLRSCPAKCSFNSKK